MMHMASQNFVNMGSGNGLVPNGTKPLPEPMLTFANNILRNTSNANSMEISWFMWKGRGELCFQKWSNFPTIQHIQA